MLQYRPKKLSGKMIMNGELKCKCREVAMKNFKAPAGLLYQQWFERLTKTVKILNQVSRSDSRNSNLRSSEQVAGILISRSTPCHLGRMESSA
jgi:hypothetical protein